MQTQTYGSVVAMQFRRRPGIEFADFVEELDTAFQMVDARSRALSWDCDDIAIIERDNVRIALGWLPPEEDGDRWHLIVAVGATPDEACDRTDPTSFRYLADRIVERSRSFLPFTAVLHGQAHQPIGPELIDTTFDLLRLEASDMPGDRRKAKKRMAFPENVEDYADMFSEMSPPWMQADADTDSESLQDAHAARPHRRIGGSVAAITGRVERMLEKRAEPTEPLRLTIHTVALSLLLTAPALGAFMFTYTMLRDMTQVTA